jgi:hypothetical protein
LFLLLLGIDFNVSFNFIVSISGSGLAYQLIMLVFTPLLAFITVYLAVYIFCSIFNVIAQRTGGIQVHFSDSK